MQRERERERAYGTLALSNDRAHLRGENGPAAYGLLSTQQDRVYRSVKTLVDGICAYTSYSPAKILPPDAASYCAPPGAISVNFGPHRIFAADLSILRAPTHDPLRSSGATMGLGVFSFSFTTRAPPFCVTETHSCTTIRWDMFRCVTICGFESG